VVGDHGRMADLVAALSIVVLIAACLGYIWLLERV
jgi:hypothetical protein